MVYRNSLAHCAAVLFALQAVNCFAAASTTSVKTVAKGGTAYINSQEVYGSASYTKDVQSMVAKFKTEAQADQRANKLMQEYQNIAQELQNPGALKPEAAQQKQERLQALQNEIEKIYKGWEEKIQAATKREMDKLVVAIEQFARKQGYTVVADVSAVVWVDPSLDVTKELVKYLNEQYNAEKAKTKTAPKKA